MALRGSIYIDSENAQYSSDTTDMLVHHVIL